MVKYYFTISRNEDYYYDEYSTENDDDVFNDYNIRRLHDGEFGNGQSQTGVSKEISNYLAKFNHQDSKHRIHITDSGNLVLRQVTREDKGSYVCRATNMVGTKSSEVAILSVHGKKLCSDLEYCKIYENL